MQAALWKHRICAYPTAISWAVGALMLNALVMISFVGNSEDASILLEPHALLTLIPTSLLGLFAGLPFMGVIGHFCERFNGAPFEVGEEVVILRGPHFGKQTTVREFTIGQGGEKLLMLELGEEIKARYGDIFNESWVTRPLNQQLENREE